MVANQQVSVAIAYIGCKVNQSETEGWATELRQAGFTIVSADQPADFYLVNTCTVTHKADRDVRKLIHKINRLAPSAAIVVAGCLVDVDPELVRTLPGVCKLMEGHEKNRIVEALCDLAGKPYQVATHAGSKPAVYWPPASDSEAERGRAFVKIQDGCDAHCAYCIVPQARGKPQSRAAEDVVALAVACEAAGFDEIVLTGVHLGRYNREVSRELGLFELLKLLLAATEHSRFRLSSIEPDEISADLIALIAAHNRICPHLHIPLQSGSDRILSAMGRRYRSAMIKELFTELTRKIPNLGIGTDLLVGFPGETDGDFRLTTRLIEQSPLTYLHVFSYSPRIGTSAAWLPQALSHQVIHSRAQHLRRIGLEKNRAFCQAQLNRVLYPVIIDADAAGRCSGLSENYLQVQFQTTSSDRRKIIAVKIVEALQSKLVGVPV